MYTYYSFECEFTKESELKRCSITYNSKYDTVSKLFEMAEMIYKCIKNAEKYDLFKMALYAIDENKATEELEKDSYTNYHGDLWECYEGNFEEGFYFAPYHNNFNMECDFVITKKNPFEMLKEISPFKSMWT